MYALQYSDGQALLAYHEIAGLKIFLSPVWADRLQRTERFNLNATVDISLSKKNHTGLILNDLSISLEKISWENGHTDSISDLHNSSLLKGTMFDFESVKSMNSHFLLFSSEATNFMTFSLVLWLATQIFFPSNTRVLETSQ